KRELRAIWTGRTERHPKTGTLCVRHVTAGRPNPGPTAASAVGPARAANNGQTPAQRREEPKQKKPRRLMCSPRSEDRSLHTVIENAALQQPLRGARACYFSGTVAGLLGSDTWITRYLSG